MNNLITVIIPIKDRENWRIKILVNSIRDTGANPKIKVIDIGSKSENSKSYVETCKELDIDYHYTASNGLPWSRSYALNTGARLAKTKYIVSCDVDLVIKENVFRYILDNVKPKEAYHFRYLKNINPKTNKIEKTIQKGFQGGFQFIERIAFEESGGYDERIEYWGREDSDWIERLKLLGYTQKFLPDNFILYHQKHPVSQAGIMKPITSPFNTLKFCTENIINPILKQNWGKVYLREERKILEYIETNNYTIFDYSNNFFFDYNPLIDLIKKISKQKGCYKIMLGKRVKNLNKIQTFILGTIKFFVPKLKERLTILNTNFDCIYTLIPMLKEKGLIDFYFTENLEICYLLF